MGALKESSIEVLRIEKKNTSAPKEIVISFQMSLNY